MQPCPSCQTENRDESRVCTTCGASLERTAFGRAVIVPGQDPAAGGGEVPSSSSTRTCPSCGTPSPATTQFCSACGTALGGAAPPAGAPSSAGTTCPSCDRPVALDRRFCQWCSQFLLKSDGVQRYAGFGRRLAAYLIDFGVPLVVLIIVSQIAPDVLFLVPLGWIVLQIMFWMRGTTLGKSILGAKVIHTDGRTVGFWSMFVREFVAKGIVANIVGVFTLGLGWLVWYLWALWDKDSQALHDKFVSSLVVYSQETTLR